MPNLRTLMDSGEVEMYAAGRPVSKSGKRPGNNDGKGNGNDSSNETQKMFEFLMKQGYKFAQDKGGMHIYENSDGDRFIVSSDGHFGHQGPLQEHVGMGLKDLKNQIDSKTKAQAVNKIYSKDKSMKAGGPGSGRHAAEGHAILNSHFRNSSGPKGTPTGENTNRYVSKALNSKLDVGDKGWSYKAKDGFSRNGTDVKPGDIHDKAYKAISDHWKSQGREKISDARLKEAAEE